MPAVDEPIFASCSGCLIEGQCLHCGASVAGTLALAWCQSGGRQVLCVAITNDEGVHPLRFVDSAIIPDAGEVPVT